MRTEQLEAIAALSKALKEAQHAGIILTVGGAMGFSFFEKNTHHPEVCFMRLEAIVGNEYDKIDDEVDEQVNLMDGEFVFLRPQEFKDLRKCMELESKAILERLIDDTQKVVEEEIDKRKSEKPPIM